MSKSSPDLSFEALTFRREGRVAIITLNRPKAANGLNAKMGLELRRAAKTCDSSDDIRAVIITGSGRFFCAGGDIKEMFDQGEAVGSAIKNLADDLHMAISTLSRMKKPVIMAVNGIAAGAGFSLAISGDIVIAADTAGFTMAYTKAGLSPDGSSSYFLPRLIGLRRAQDLMFTNRTLSAQEALNWGLVTRLAPADDLMTTALEIAQTLAAGAAGSNAAVKALLLSSFNNSLETQMELEGRMISANAASPDGREGITAFVEKRPPKFS